MYSRYPIAHVFSSGEAHLKTLSIMDSVVKCCMTPAVEYRTKLTIIEDGSESDVVLPYNTALEVAAGPPVYKAERVKCSQRGGASIVLAFLAGQAQQRVETTDKIIVFSSDPFLRTELLKANIEVVSPIEIDAHQAWWASRETSLIGAASTSPILLASDPSLDVSSLAIGALAPMPQSPPLHPSAPPIQPPAEAESNAPEDGTVREESADVPPVEESLDPEVVSTDDIVMVATESVAAEPDPAKASAPLVGVAVEPDPAKASAPLVSVAAEPDPVRTSAPLVSVEAEQAPVALADPFDFSKLDPFEFLGPRVLAPPASSSPSDEDPPSPRKRSAKKKRVGVRVARLTR